MAKPVEIDVKLNGLGAIKAELRTLKGEIANATDPKEIERLSQAAGKLADQIADANERVRIFAAGSEFEKIGNGIGLVSTQLKSLDFEGAAESAKLLTNTIRQMNPAELINGFKGLMSTVTELGNAFLTMGLQLLANPLFLLVAIVVAVVSAIVLLKDKIKIVGDAFDLLMQPINIVIQLLKDLTDWLGLTSFVEQEAAQKTEDAANKRIAANARVSDQMDKEFKRQIALAKANGQDVTNLQIEQAKTQQNISYANVQAIDKAIATNREAQKNASQDELDDLKKKEKELVKQRRENVDKNKDAANEILVVQATARVKGEEDAKKAKEKSDADAKKAIADKKKAAADAKKIADDADKAFDTNLKKEVDKRIAHNEFIASVEADAVGVVIEAQDEKNAAIDYTENQQAKADQNTLFAAKSNADAKDKIRTIDTDNQKKALNATANILQGAANLLGEQTEAGKVASIAATTISTYESATEAYASLAGIPIVGPALGAAAAGIAIANGIANVKRIIAVKTPKGSTSSSTNISSANGGGTSSTPLTPQVQLVGNRNDNINNAVSAQSTQNQSYTIKAVVSETEITNKQAFISKIKSSAEI